MQWMKGVYSVEMAKVTCKGQITIPVSIRRRLNINEGDKILFIDSPDGVVMVNPDMLHGGRGAANAESGVRNPEPVRKVAPAVPQQSGSISSIGSTGDSPIAKPAIVRDAQSAPGEFASGKPVAAVNAVSESAAVEPAIIEPAAVEPEAYRPGSAEPVTARPGSAEPEGYRPSSTEPEAYRPYSAEPEAVEPGHLGFDSAAGEAPRVAASAIPLPVEAPAEKEEEKPAAQDSGFNLRTLMEEIRSIGSKI